MPEFDPHAIIRWLVELKQRCFNCDGLGFIFVPTSGQYEGEPRTRKQCEDCGGTGYIVPFVSLRTLEQLEERLLAVEKVLALVLLQTCFDLTVTQADKDRALYLAAKYGWEK